MGTFSAGAGERSEMGLLLFGDITFQPESTLGIKELNS